MITAKTRLEHIIQHLQPTTTNNTLNQQNLNTKKQYKYTVNKNTISETDRDFYEENGYLLVRGVVPEEDLQIYHKRFVEVANEDITVDKRMTVMRDILLAKQKGVKGEEYITKIQDLIFDDTFFSYATHPAILPYVKDIIGDDLRAMHTMLINKPPDLGKGSSRHPPHQDMWYFNWDPDKTVCAWTAMQVINKNNGCLFVVPGSHRGKLLPHGYPNDEIVNKMYYGIHGLTERDTDSMVHAEMGPGDVLFFHPLLIHGSGRNNSKGFRKAISCHYANPTACTYMDLTGTIQEGLVTEVLGMSKKRFGMSMQTYSDVWRLRSRHVLGEEGNLA